MILPKRVPWQTVADLDEVCSWIYGPQTDAASKLLAKNRLCAWQVNTPLPHALESVLSFLNALLLESDTVHSTTLRQVYALAIVRFVNGLVDPLQQGVYARPIYSLAAQIGLPAWIVELRHRSTHEDLPSLEVLREATREAMEWLLNRYFLPTLEPTNSTSSNIELPPLDPLLSTFKSLMKAGLKDASLQSRNKPEIDRLLKNFASWITDVSTLYAADSSVRGTDAAAPSQKLRIATQRFTECLCDKGGFVPSSKSKRIQQNKPLIPPPNEAIWAPLILYIDQQNEYLVEELLGCMLNLLNNADTDPTFSATIASWLIWVIHNLGDEQGVSKIECVRNLLSGASSNGESPIVQAVINTLTTDDASLLGQVTCLRAVTKPQRQVSWDVNSMYILEERQKKLGEAMQARMERKQVPEAPQIALLSNENEELPPGWFQVPQSSWVPCPIGAPMVL